jgi:hypothetical protein
LTKEKAVDELYSAIQRAIAAVQPILILDEKPATNTPTGTEDTQQSQPSDAVLDKERHR